MRIVFYLLAVFEERNTIYQADEQNISQFFSKYLTIAFKAKCNQFQIGIFNRNFYFAIDNCHLF